MTLSLQVLTVGQVFCVLTGTGVSNLIQPSLLGTSVATYTLYTYLCDKKSSTVQCTLYIVLYCIYTESDYYVTSWTKDCSFHEKLEKRWNHASVLNINMYIYLCTLSQKIIWISIYCMIRHLPLHPWQGTFFYTKTIPVWISDVTKR